MQARILILFLLMPLSGFASRSNFAKPIHVLVIAGDESALGSRVSHFSELKRNASDARVPFKFLQRTLKEPRWSVSAPGSTLATPHSSSKQHFAGVELSLIRNLQLENPKQDWAVLKLTQESSSLIHNWLRGYVWNDAGQLILRSQVAFRNSLLQKLFLECDQFLLELRSRGYSPKVASLIWAHRFYPQDSLRPGIYEQALHRVIDLFRARYHPAIPFVILSPEQMKTEKNARFPASELDSETLKIRTTLEDPLARYISLQGLPRSGNREISAQGQLVLGHRVAMDLLKLLP